MKLYISIFVGLVVAMGSFSEAKAVVLLNDNFDSYADTAAFQAVWPAVGSQASGTITQEVSVSSPNAVQIFSPAPSGVTDQRNERVISGGAVMSQGAQYIWSFDFYDTDAAAPAYRQFSNLQDTTAPTLTNQLISLPLNNNYINSTGGGNFYMARILGYAPNAVDPDGGPGDTINTAGQFFKLNDFNVGLRSTGWHNFKTIITSDDGLSQDYEFYVDNVLAEKVSNVGTTASLRKYDVVRIGPGISSTTDTVAFDNEYVEYNAAVVGLTGDFNNDGKVDAQDYVVFKKYEGTNYDLPNNGANTTPVGPADYTLFLANFGNPPGSGSGFSGAEVPEPTTVGLLLVGMAVLGGGRSRRV